MARPHLHRPWRGRRPNLLVTFGVLSAIPLAVLAVVLGHTLHGIAVRRALADNRNTITFVASVGVGAYLDEASVRRGVFPARAIALKSTLERLQRQRVLKAIGIWTPHGLFRFGDLPPIASNSHGITSALAGETVSEIRANLLIVYAPLVFGSSTRAAGVIVAAVPYDAVREQVAHDTRRLYLIMLAGLALVWATLFPIVAMVSRKLRRQAEENERLARHDVLTGLPNRMYFQELLEESRGRGVGAIVIDLDDFKSVNDEHGHHVGDLVLAAIAERLRGAVRESDVVARFGGDEFAVLVRGAGANESLEPLAGRIVAALADPVPVEGLLLQVHASVGASAQLLDDTDELVRRADAAMYRAKASGGDAHRVDVTAA